MVGFPLLGSGAVTQYPADSYIGQSVGVIRFLDGSDQRFLHVGRQLRRWHINLALLSDAEVSAVELFFIAQKGVFSPFTFIDPATNMQIPNCRFATAEMISEYMEGNNNATSFWIMETNG